MGGRLLLLRHGESTLNATSTFTGLLDAPLSPAGEKQVGVAASLVNAVGLRPDLLVTTPMLRARRTAELLLAGLGLVGVPEVVTWRLLERDYGRLTGMAKADARVLLGEEAFFRLRRTMLGRPPAASTDEAASWPMAPVADRGPLVPGTGESLADVVERVAPLWTRTIQPALASGHDVFVVAHGNSLRALSAIMENLDDAETERLNIPAGHPLVYAFTPDGLIPRGGRYLDAAAADAAADQVAAEGGT